MSIQIKTYYDQAASLYIYKFFWHNYLAINKDFKRPLLIITYYYSADHYGASLFRLQPLWISHIIDTNLILPKFLNC